MIAFAKCKSKPIIAEPGGGIRVFRKHSLNGRMEGFCISAPFEVRHSALNASRWVFREKK